jgi:hypothetical protein
MKAIKIKLTVVSLSLMLLGALSVRSQAKPAQGSGDQNNSTASNPDTPPPPDQQGHSGGGGGAPSEGQSNAPSGEAPQAPDTSTQTSGGCCGSMGGQQ